MTWDALWSQHTVKLGALDPTALVAKLTSAAAKPVDAIALMAVTFTPVKPTALPPGGDKAMAQALAMAERFDAASAKAFIDQVVFNAAHPEAHLYLWHAVSRCVSAKACEEQIILRLAGSNALHQANALALMAAVFGVRDDYRLSDAARAKITTLAQRLAAADKTPEPVRARARLLVPAVAAPPTRDLAALYDQCGGGARDRSAKPVKAPGGKPTTTRSVAPLVTSVDFAAKVAALGGTAAVGEFLPKLAQMPEPMRILTLEALYSAQSQDEVMDIIAQTQSLLGG